jgi:hydroxymethylpyrimidine pyrophosphatase-like HAD family hydrolase
MKLMTIKAIILDVDGVITGSKYGYNSPEPNIEVSKKIVELNDSGIPVMLNTGKPGFGIESMVIKMRLDNYHASDGGGLVHNWISDETLEKNIIDSKLSNKLIKRFVEERIQFEINTKKDFYIYSELDHSASYEHAKVIMREPKVIDDIYSVLSNEDVTKILAIAEDESQMPLIERIFKEEIGSDLNLNWGIHPSTMPLRYGVITKAGKTKGTAAEAMIKDLAISFENTLGVGDSMHDWDFIKKCGYKATLLNGSDEVKSKIKEHHGLIGGDVDENGILDIFNKLGL